MNLIPPVLDSTDSNGYSYPINSEFPNSISFSGVQAGLLMAYGSMNLIIVLIEGKHITSVLKGHESTVSTVSFEMRGPHIVSCDISARCLFWHYQDSIWQNTRVVQLNIPFTSASWYTARREICFSTNDGLFHCSLTDFGTRAEKLSTQSCFCTFNSDGSLLASHNKKTTVSIFMFTSIPYLTQVVRHPSPIVTLDFHPSLPAFLTITKDNILRIWRQSVLSTFACTAAMKVPLFGYFVRRPIFFSENSIFGIQKPTKIVFLDRDNKTYKIQVDENGRIVPSPNDGNIFLNVNEQPDFGFRAVLKTNLGTESIVVSPNKISIVTKSLTRNFIFHTFNIKYSEFAPDNFWLLTLDKKKSLIVWPIFNPYHSSKLISQSAKFAVWRNANSLVYLDDRKLKLYDTLKNISSDFTDFNPNISLNNDLLSHVKHLFANKNGDIYMITKTNIISKNKIHPIKSFSHIAFSRPYNDRFIILLSDSRSHHLEVILCPSMTSVTCSSRGSAKIRSLGVVSLVMFVVLTDDDLEFWSYRNEKFECVNKIFLSGMTGLYCDSSSIGGRILAYDSTRLYSIANGVVPLYTSSNISGLAVSSFGHIAVVWGKHFHVFPSWCIPKPSIIPTADPNFSRTDQLMNIGNLPPDAKFIAKVTTPPSINYMISPLTYANPPDNIINTVQATLFHLLECRIISNLSHCTPDQIPAIPNQYTVPSALEFPKDYENEDHIRLIRTILQIKEDIDMFGMRYLLAIKENAWPPSYFALWLSFSQRQSQVAKHLTTYIDTNMLSKFYIAASIHQHSVLVNLVQNALQNMWIAVQKVDNVALLYAALGQNAAIAKLYNAIGDDQKGDFFKNNFATERWRKSAIKNAYSSLSHHNLEMSATLFLVAGEIKLCINIVSTKLRDPMLSLLVLRLLTKSDYKDAKMRDFLDNVDWNDEALPLLISNLTKDGKVTNLLEKMILDKDIVKNITAFGDRRITLFELYHNITRKRDIVARLTMNMNQDGLSPLSNYIYGLLSCPFETFRAVEQFNEVEDEDVTTSDVTTVISYEDMKISEIGTFDFGGSKEGWNDDANNDDDIWSDDFDDTEQEKPTINSKENCIENEVSSQNSEQKDQNLNDSEVKENTSILIQETKETEIFEQFLNNLTYSLCSFFGGDQKDEYAGEFAMRASSIANASKLLSPEKRRSLLNEVSLFIDCCCTLFFESASIPLNPKKLLNLVIRLYKIISSENSTPSNSSIEEITSLNLKTILKYIKSDFIHSVYNGAIVVSIWTYFPNFLVQLLDESVEAISINNNTIPPARSFFDVDLTSPKFPDSIPLLLTRYTIGKAFQVASLERDRLLIMLLIFDRVLKTNQRFKSDVGGDFINSLISRHKSMLKSLSFYEIALGSPLFEQPPPDKDNSCGPISAIIDQEFNESATILQQIQNGSLSKQPFPPVFRNGQLSVAEKVTLSHQFSSVQRIAFMPLDKTKAVIIADGQLIKVDFRDQNNVVFSKFPKNSDAFSDAIDVIPHPTFNLFVTISPNNAALFDFQHDITDYKFSVSSSSSFPLQQQQQQQKITCAVFSPNGTKLAICSNCIDIFSFDLSKWDASPTISRDLKAPITAVAWINSDTSLAVAYSNNNNGGIGIGIGIGGGIGYSNGSNCGNIVIVNTLTKFNQPIEVKKEWGLITNISSNIRRGKLVFGSKNGYIVITDMKRNFETVCIITLGMPIVSLFNLQEIVVIGAENGHVVVFSTSKPTQSSQFETGYRINTVSMSEKMIISAGDSSHFSVWNSL